MHPVVPRNRRIGTCHVVQEIKSFMTNKSIGVSERAKTFLLALVAFIAVEYSNVRI